MIRSNRSSAMLPVPALPPPAARLPAATLLCALSLVASARPMQIKIPKFDLPKLPDIDLPNFGKKSPAKQPVVKKRVAAPGTNVKVRAASSAAAKDAPTLAELTGKSANDSIPEGDGWRRFPVRRMPGANMDLWKGIAKQLTPKL